jgi:hypothetical protein
MLSLPHHPMLSFRGPVTLMRLANCFVKLPLEFDSERLAEEISQFAEEEWRAHPQRFEGNSALVLVSRHGTENDEFIGPMRPAPRLEKMPYVRQVMASFGSVIGRSRMMRLTPGASVAHHTDSNYFWRNHLRIHVPVLTEPEVAFYCDGEEVHMAAGESWTFDNWREHSVENRSDETRIHLVIDTVGSSRLWQMIDGRDTTRRNVPFDPDADPPLQFESFRGMPVLPPAELRTELTTLVGDIADETDIESAESLRANTRDFVSDWQSLWMVSGPSVDGFPEYRSLLNAYRAKVEEAPDELRLVSNSRPVKESIFYTLDAALEPDNLEVAGPGGPEYRPRFDRPVFIVAAPRSGSTLLFETLAVNRELWTVGGEAHKHFEIAPELRPGPANSSNRLTSGLATRDIAETILNALAADLVNSDGRKLYEMGPASRPADLRFLEKTPKNALRIPFIHKLFPDARFIFLFRDARQNVSSLMDSWRSQRYVTYSALPGWSGELRWSHLLIPGWESLVGKPLAEVAACQWLVTNQTILDDLRELPPERWCAVEYDDFIDNTMQQLTRLCAFAQIVFGPRMFEVASRPLKPSKYTLTPPSPDKWRKNAADLESVLPATEDLMAELRHLAAG